MKFKILIFIVLIMALGALYVALAQKVSTSDKSNLSLEALNQKIEMLKTDVEALKARVSDLQSRLEKLEGAKKEELKAKKPMAPQPLVEVSDTYIGNSNSLKFHRPICQWAKNISPANRVEFKSKQDAISQGYVGCKVCKP
jgi:hypothetical protein